MMTECGPMKSWLFTPATRPDRFENAACAGADNVMIGLGDAVGARSHFVILPRADSPAHMVIVDRLLASASMPSRLVALVEGAAALADVDEIASATPRMTAIVLGTADMAADLGVATAWEPLLYARSRIVPACAAGLSV